MLYQSFKTSQTFGPPDLNPRGGTSVHAKLFKILRPNAAGLVISTHSSFPMPILVELIAKQKKSAALMLLINVIHFTRRF